ncbi:oxidoreductase (plasmid) [Azospirillum sp. B510]|uniref:aldo/keto reductase n=1 Tax=Azospirillum sp. (strain B510) TaxID=137722 RepID=UPI0001C4CF65|nr:aldo/keto reductase [Azospirillum sp. B510]BAI76699.1 oxidoreductase [Azospirillum sp. B510]
MKRVTLPDGTEVPALGQGTWMMAEGRGDRAAEIAAIRAGIDHGLTLIDTAEMYGDGASEELVGEAIAGRRDGLFIVTKVLPSNASHTGAIRACERSLKRLGIDRIDLYLLHWRGGVPLAETVEAFETLIQAGKIARWGVSNFDVGDLEELAETTDLHGCAVNQVLYNPEHRGIEYDLLPFQHTARMPVMAYSPIGQGGRLLRSPALSAVAKRHDATPAQVALAWALRQQGVIAIPKAGTRAHVVQNAEAARLTLTGEDMAEIDRAFPPPKRKQPLAMI